MRVATQAAENNHREIVELLLRNGADVNAQNWKNYTALIWAARQGFVDLARLLAEHGYGRCKFGVPLIMLQCACKPAVH